eukprot:CAMPEP_0197526680 /NCGR_PEP_ID=MMETSP1318-20131121/18825_1 /TAXON_ID=552666 /ORGANISM="Partenskyella glossopodia, Strain RCC365" /LENGTH=277 /DNA_ID=CAMNT_0043080961 /DNA_START=330 /DNA_END=1163 /DNA_ORIENTATION=+
MKITGCATLAGDRYSAALSLLYAQNTAYVVDVKLTKTSKNGGKIVTRRYGSILPNYYISPEIWAGVTHTGFEFYLESSSVPSSQQKFDDQSNCYFRYGIATDEPGARRGLYKKCIVEADDVILRGYTGSVLAKSQNELAAEHNDLQLGQRRESKGALPRFTLENNSEVAEAKLEQLLAREIVISGRFEMPFDHPVLMSTISAEKSVSIDPSAIQVSSDVSADNDKPEPLRRGKSLTRNHANEDNNTYRSELQGHRQSQIQRATSAGSVFDTNACSKR